MPRPNDRNGSCLEEPENDHSGSPAGGDHRGLLVDEADDRVSVSHRLNAVAALLSLGASKTNWIEREVRGLAQLVGEGDVCIDVGAEYGLYAMSLATLVGPRGHVVAVEPLSNLARLLSMTARTLGAPWVTVAPVALGARSGDGVISVPRRWGLPVHGRSYLIEGSINAGPNHEFRSADTVDIHMRTLDELCAGLDVSAVDFIKMDVEGAELAVLAGAESVLRTRPTMMLEIERRHLARYGRRVTDVVNFLEAKGYSMYAWIDEAWRSVSEPRPGLRNYLFCHQSTSIG